MKNYVFGIMVLALTLLSQNVSADVNIELKPKEKKMPYMYSAASQIKVKNLVTSFNEQVVQAEAEYANFTDRYLLKSSQFSSKIHKLGWMSSVSFVNYSHLNFKCKKFPTLVNTGTKDARGKTLYHIVIDLDENCGFQSTGSSLEERIIK